MNSDIAQLENYIGHECEAGVKVLLLYFFQNIFGVPRCTKKYLFVVTSSVRGEICVH